MGLSKLSEECKKCPFVEKCKNKRMEALAYMTEPQVLANAAAPSSENLAAPLLRVLQIIQRRIGLFREENAIMIKIENVEVMGWEHAIRGMRNPMNSWERADSGICKGGESGIGCENCANYDSCEHTYDHSWQLGKADHDLMMRLSAGGSTHAKYRRMIIVYADITAPLYWWKEFDTYKVGTVANSCSTMHKIHAREFTLEDFSTEHLYSDELEFFKEIVDRLNGCRNLYLDSKKNESPRDVKNDWWQMIQLLPSSYNQRRTVMLNYEVLANIYKSRRNHKLDEWHTFCDWIESLPYSELITGEKKG
nr:MAG TPA: hypothetical protein [Caudoviricetes sp.]